ncbi:MAG: hypothetical protein J5I98_30725, partial [Phaeodactylibacter sp.]|nr:hypothetical protein [Phaeodactylibacter sp.]
ATQPIPQRSLAEKEPDQMEKLFFSGPLMAIGFVHLRVVPFRGLRGREGKCTKSIAAEYIHVDSLRCEYQITFTEHEESYR